MNETNLIMKTVGSLEASQIIWVRILGQSDQMSLRAGAVAAAGWALGQAAEVRYGLVLWVSASQFAGIVAKL